MAFEVFEGTRPAGMVSYGQPGWKETEAEPHLHCLLEMAPGMWLSPKTCQEGKRSQRVLDSTDKNHAKEIVVIKQWQQAAAQDTNSVPGPILFPVWS